jgi:hypothetical protein
VVEGGTWGEGGGETKKQRNKLFIQNRLLRSSEGKQWTVPLLYGLEPTEGVSFYLSDKSPHLFHWPSHFPQTRSTNATSQSFPKGVPTQHTIMPAVNNPGFDIVVFEEKRAGGTKCEYYYLFCCLLFVDLLFCVAEPLIFCIECRFSDPDSKMTMDKASIADKREKTVEQFRPYFKKGTILPSQTMILIKRKLQEHNWEGSL